MNRMDQVCSRKVTGNDRRSFRDSDKTAEAMTRKMCHPKMYERLGQRFRQIMAAQQFLSTIKYVAGTKPSFLLSEIAAYLEEPLTIGQMYAALQPHLAGLGLSAQKTGEDYTISRLLPSPALYPECCRRKTP